MNGLLAGQCAVFTDGWFMLDARLALCALLPEATAPCFLLISDVITLRCSAQPTLRLSVLALFL